MPHAYPAPVAQAAGTQGLVDPLVQDLVADDLPVDLEQVEIAGAAWGQHIEASQLLFGQGQIAGRKRVIHEFADRFGRAGTAAGPVRNVDKLHSQPIHHGPHGDIELPCAFLQGAARIVGVLHTSSSISRTLAKRALSRPFWLPSGTCSLPTRIMRTPRGR